MSYWKCTTSEIIKIFHASTVVFKVTMKMKIVRKQFLDKLQKNTRRHQKIRKLGVMT
jgi:hypothetical protein